MLQVKNIEVQAQELLHNHTSTKAVGSTMQKDGFLVCKASEPMVEAMKGRGNKNLCIKSCCEKLVYLGSLRFWRSTRALILNFCCVKVQEVPEGSLHIDQYSSIGPVQLSMNFGKECYMTYNNYILAPDGSLQETVTMHIESSA